ncbi:MAG: family efflux transporter, subunit, partial [Dehalococcoidia bacterium]|nr:family efflux transporter, subunit [Dehalococcoidia bacterium]
IRNIIDARMRLWNARQKLGEDRYRGASPEQIAADEEEILLAYRAVEVAEEDLNWPELGISAEDIIVAQGAIDEAEASLRSVTAKLGELKAGPKPQEIQSAQATVEQAKSSLASAQADLEILRYPSNSDLQSAKSSVDKAKADITSAETRLAQLKNPTPLDLASAEASVEQAQSNLRSAQVKLDQLLGGPKTVDLVAAQSSVVQAESQLTLRQSPYTNEDILTAQAQVSQAEASLAEAVLNQEGSTLYAPFAGVVSAVNITPQRSAGSGAGSVAVAISILDPTAFKVDLDVDESEVAKVDLDQSATITFDSLTGRRFRGKVIAIAPQATTASGVTSYQVSLGIGEGQGIKAGMTAFAEIVYASKENVITVPSRAVTRQGRNQMVKVMVDGKPQAKEVKTGITDGSKIEVVEGLQEGEQVVIPNSTAPAQGTANTRVPGAGFGGGGPGLAPGGFPAGGARR